MDRDQAIPGARVTWADAPDDPFDGPCGLIACMADPEVFPQAEDFVFVRWDDAEPDLYRLHDLADLRLLPDEAQP